VAGHAARVGVAGGSSLGTPAEANETVTTHRKLAQAAMPATFQSNVCRRRDIGRHAVSVSRACSGGMVPIAFAQTGPKRPDKMNALL
jgi:hypothetical protein